MEQLNELSALLPKLESLLPKAKPEPPPSILDENFKCQVDFIRDPATLKAAFCTRRSAKSYTGGLYLVKEALENPGVSCLYVALTRDSAKKIMWKDVLKTIDRKNNLKAAFNETLLTMTLSNGSIIYLTGVDADEEEKNKLLGQKYRLCVCDEASTYSINLRELIYGILKPAVADYRGTICLLGTAGNITQGLFFDITNRLEPGWSLHKWTAFENPYIARQWKEEIEEIENTRPLFKQTPLFRQWYLNEWVIDTTKLVYWYQEGRNDYSKLDIKGDWQYVLGVDLGYRPDPSAFCLLGFHAHDKVLYVIESFKRLEMDITDVANCIKTYQSRFPIFKVIIDGSAKQAVEEMQKRHGIALTAADKRGKSDFIEIMNAEFVQERIKINPYTNPELIDEWKRLVWKMTGESIDIPRTEHPGLPNHISDACLYGWRYCYQFLSMPMEPKVDIRSPQQYLKHTEKLMEQNLERQIQVERAQENENDFWAIAPLDDETDVLRHYLNKKKHK
jgi:phage terminase large subunit